MRALVCFFVLAMVVSSAHALNYYWQTKIDGKGLVAFDATLVIPKLPTKNLQVKVGLYPSSAPVSQEHHPLVHMLESHPAPLAEEDVELQAKTTPAAKPSAAGGKAAAKSSAAGGKAAAKSSAAGGKAGVSADNWASADTTSVPDKGTPLPGASAADGSQEAIECVISEASQTNKKTKATRRAFTSNCSPGTKVLQGKAQTPKGNSFNGAQAIRVQAYMKSRSGSARQTWATLTAPQGGANDAGTFDVKGAAQFNIFKVTITAPDATWSKTSPIHLEKLTLEYEPGAAAAAEKAFCPASSTEVKRHGSTKLLVTTLGNPKIQTVKQSQTRLSTKSCVINKMALTTPGGMRSGDNDTEDALVVEEVGEWESAAEKFVQEQEAADAASALSESSSSGGSAVGGVVGALAAVGVVAGAGAYLYLKKRKAAAAGATPAEGAGPEGGKKAKANVKHARLEETTTPRAAHSAVMPR